MGTSDQRFSLRWNNYQSHLVTAFESLLEEKDFVDVTLGVEGRKLPAHKMLLSACSPYFRDLLKVNHRCSVSIFFSICDKPIESQEFGGDFVAPNLMPFSNSRATPASTQSSC